MLAYLAVDEFLDLILHARRPITEIRLRPYVLLVCRVAPDLQRYQVILLVIGELLIAISVFGDPRFTLIAYDVGGRIVAVQLATQIVSWNRDFFMENPSVRPGR